MVYVDMKNNRLKSKVLSSNDVSYDTTKTQWNDCDMICVKEYVSEQDMKNKYPKGSWNTYGKYDTANENNNNPNAISQEHTGTTIRYYMHLKNFPLPKIIDQPQNKKLDQNLYQYTNNPQVIQEYFKYYLKEGQDQISLAVVLDSEFNIVDITPSDYSISPAQMYTYNASPNNILGSSLVEDLYPTYQTYLHLWDIFSCHYSQYKENCYLAPKQILGLIKEHLENVEQTTNYNELFQNTKNAKCIGLDDEYIARYFNHPTLGIISLDPPKMSGDVAVRINELEAKLEKDAGLNLAMQGEYKSHTSNELFMNIVMNNPETLMFINDLADILAESIQNCLPLLFQSMTPEQFKIKHSKHDPLSLYIVQKRIMSANLDFKIDFGLKDGENLESIKHMVQYKPELLQQSPTFCSLFLQLQNVPDHETIAQEVNQFAQMEQHIEQTQEQTEELLKDNESQEKEIEKLQKKINELKYKNTYQKKNG